MNKLKKFWENNRIYCILMCVSALCLAIIAIITIIYFINQTKTDLYGNRLNGIEAISISNEKQDEISSKIKEMKNVDSAKLELKGKIIYFYVVLTEGTVDEAQNIAIKSLELLEESEKDYYDISFAFLKKDDDKFAVMGYKKSDATLISWVKSSGEEEE